MRIENFSNGIFSESGEVPQGELALADAINLRINKNGSLVPRVPYSDSRVNNDLASIGVTGDIQGINEVGNIKFFNVDGTLYYQVGAGVINSLSHVNDLKGRITLVENYYDNYTVLTSEGNDGGWLIELNDVTNITALPMSLPKPEFLATAARDIQTITGHPPYNLWHYYCFVYETLPGSLLDKVESPRSNFIQGEIVRMKSAQGVEEVRVIRTRGNEFPISTVYNEIQVIGIFRSEGFEDMQDLNSLKNSSFRRIGELRRGETEFVDNKTDEDWNNGRRLPDITPSFPREATSILYSNGYLFTTCGKNLRFNDVETRGPKVGYWPITNSVEYEDAEFNFAVNVDNYVLTGDQQNSIRVYSSQNIAPTQVDVPFQTPVFPLDKISDRGSINSFTTKMLLNGVGMIGENGLYIASRNGNMNKVSAPLDQFFKDRNIVDGSITQFPDETILWNVVFADGSKRQFIMVPKSNGVVWETWEGVDVLQSIQTKSSDVVISVNGRGWTVGGKSWLFNKPEISYTQFMAADGDGNAKLIEWNKVFDSPGNVEWSIESHDLFRRNEVLGMDLKLFRSIFVDAEADNPVNFTFTFNDGSEIEETVDFSNSIFAKEIPIRGHGQSMRFKMSGTGQVEIRGLVVDYEVSRRIQI